MSQNTKALRIRIKSVNSTMQLTNAMGLVASSKIRRANEAMMKARDYMTALENTISVLSADRESLKSPFMQERETARTKIIMRIFSALHPNIPTPNLLASENELAKNTVTILFRPNFIHLMKPKNSQTSFVQNSQKANLTDSVLFRQDTIRL